MNIACTDHTYFMATVSFDKRDRKGVLKTETALVDVRDWETMWQDIGIALRKRGAVFLRLGMTTVYAV